MGFTRKGKEKFVNWINYVKSKGNFFFSVRNDGAISTLVKKFPAGFDKNFTSLVDGGFLVNKLDIIMQI